MKMDDRRYNYGTLQLLFLLPLSVTAFLGNNPIITKPLKHHRDVSCPDVSNTLTRAKLNSDPSINNRPITITSTLLKSSNSDETTTILTAPSDPAKRSKHSKEFFSMMDDFSHYTPLDIASVDNPRYRALFLGIAAGAQTPPVLRAFEVLYEDMIPVRVAGRMIYRHLSNVMETSLELRESETKSIGEKTGLSVEEIDTGRRAFLAIKDDDEREGLNMEELVESGIVQTAVELFGFQSFDEFMTVMDEDQNGLISFEEFMIGLQRCAEDSEEDTCTIPYVLKEIEERMRPLDAERRLSTVDERKKKYVDRYENMVETFKEWEDRVPGGEGRMLDVLRGCFVGARSVEIVNALRIVYLDYSALRVAGDLVFKLSKKLMGSKG